LLPRTWPSLYGYSLAAQWSDSFAKASAWAVVKARWDPAAAGRLAGRLVGFEEGPPVAANSAPKLAAVHNANARHHAPRALHEVDLVWLKFCSCR